MDQVKLRAAQKRLAAAQVPVRVRAGESRMDAAIRWGDELAAAKAAIAKAQES